jgi:MFS family permease
LCLVLHAFTHIYGSMLVPLYLLIARDLNLGGVGRVGGATLIVTVYGVVYNLLSFPAGILADRHNRKWLLGIGLIGNAAAILLMGFTRQYEMLLALGALAGVFGSLFHPAAGALAPAHYPRAPGLAIGLLGIGAGIGFFAGPQIAGWRAASAMWQPPLSPLHLGHVSAWQRPCVELGLAGVIMGIIFLLVGVEAKRQTDVALPSEHALGKSLRWRIAAVGLVLGFRDFAGVAGLSLVSIFLQKAHRYDVKHAGLVVGGIVLLSVVGNPLLVYLSPGRRRLPMLTAVLIAGGIVVCITPLLSGGGAAMIAVLCIFFFFQLGSYAVSDAAMLERIAADKRGRTVGLFLFIAGSMASTGPWIMGWWSDHLGAGASNPKSYWPAFCVLGAGMWLATGAVGLIRRLGPVSAIEGDVSREVRPATMETVA